MKRTGFLLSNIYQGSSIAMWKAIAEASLAEDGVLYVFPGGRLEYDDEYLKNSIYALASPENIDNAIIWASALTGKGDPAAFVREKASQMHVVSIGLCVDGIASVSFDAYAGMLSEVRHFIYAHHQTRIAFLRGPENHDSSQRRYRAYLDALEEAGIPYDPELVTTPRSWADGRAGIEELVEKRGLVPGKDFTALIAASDMLLLAADGYLEQIGCRVPDDIILGGFNANEENILIRKEPTTVRLPVVQLARAACCLLAEDVNAEIILPAPLVIRASCGCAWKKNKEEYLEAISNELRSDEELSRIFEAADSGSEDLEKMVEAYSGGNAALLSGYAALSEKHEANRLFTSIIQAERVKTVRERFNTRYITNCLDAFKRELFASRSADDIPSIMRNTLPLLGISKCFVVLYRDFTESVLKGGFSKDRLYTEEIPFLRKKMLPASLEEEERGTFVIEPLYYANEELGYLVIGTSWCEGYILEDIRSSLSSALKSLLISAESKSVKKAAEEEERFQLEFYSRVSEGMQDSLSQVKKLIESGSDRSLVLDKLTAAEHLLELSMDEYDHKEIVKRLLSASNIAADALAIGMEGKDIPEKLPAVEADRDIIRQVLSISYFLLGKKAALSVSLSLEGVVFLMEGSPEMSKNSIELAEKHVILHSGTYRVSSSGIRLTLPYPTLSSAAAAKAERIICLKGDEIPSSLMPLSPEIIAPEALPEALSSGNPAIAWTKNQKILGRVLGGSRSARSIPCICFSLGDEISLKSVIGSPEKTHICIIGDVTLPPALRSYDTLRLSPDELDAADGAMILTAGLGPAVRLKSQQRFARTPVIALCAHIDERSTQGILELPNLMIVNTSILESPDVASRLIELLSGGNLLPALTGVLVKKAILYINRYARTSISRWQLAEAVNISEDYLTRIFRKEIGISPWDYLNRYRIQIASDLLTSTAASISDIASAAGFQDQAYFCRVFKKIKGVSPGQIRRG